MGLIYDEDDGAKLRRAAVAAVAVALEPQRQYLSRYLEDCSVIAFRTVHK